MQKITFLNINITRAVEVIFEDELSAAPEYAEMVEHFLDKDNKVSMSLDTDQGTYGVYITGKAGTPNGGFCFGQRGGSLQSAMAKCYLVDTQLAPDGDWSNAANNLDKILQDVLRNALGR